MNRYYSVTGTASVYPPTDITWPSRIIRGDWPLETVTLLDVNEQIVTWWTGYAVPESIGSHWNENCQCLYTLVFSCGYRVQLAVGDLKIVIWPHLAQHDQWHIEPLLFRIVPVRLCPMLST